MKVLTIFGTRPEVVKLAPVVHQLRSAGVECRVCLTAQHREMVDPLLCHFGITPDLDLDVMQPDQQLGLLTATLLERLDSVVRAEQPDWVMVQGDTTTAFAGALTAYYHQIPIAHVEAGLRTDDLLSPFPEEGNRRLVDALAALCFAPTVAAAENLRREGILEERIVITGNTVVDALNLLRRQLAENSQGRTALRELEQVHGVPIDSEPLVLVTGHRRESFGSEFEGLCEGLRRLAHRFPEAAIVYPVHLNPNVQAPVRRILDDVPGVYLTRPLDYPTFIELMVRAKLILTDSGGVLEEATALGKPVLILRHKTERPEAIEAGLARLVGTDPLRIVEEAARLLSDARAYAEMTSGNNPFGDGHASDRIVDALFRRSAVGTGSTSIGVD